MAVNLELLAYCGYCHTRLKQSMITTNRIFVDAY